VGTGAWVFKNTAVADGTTLASALVSTTEVLETYGETNPTIVTNPNSATVGKHIEYDWALDPASAVIGEKYYFRMVKSNGDPLDGYSNIYPAIRIAISVKAGGGGGASSPTGQGNSGGGSQQAGGNSGGGNGATNPSGHGDSGGGSTTTGGTATGGGGASPVIFDWRWIISWLLNGNK
jgi:hypothetical protein